MERYLKIAEDVEREFTEPNYLKQRIRYAIDEESADVCINAKHSLGDYLVVGTIALANTIAGKSGDILVYSKRFPELDTVGILSNRSMQKIQKIQVDSNTYMQLYKPIEVIYLNLYKGKHKMLGVGLSIATSLMMQDAGVQGSIPEEIMSEIEFTSFDDVETTQKNAFFIIKKLTAASTAGTYYAMENGIG